MKHLQTVLFVLCCSATQTFASKGGEKCPEDYVPDLNGKCVKRFVLPSRKQCQTPDVKFGGFELELVINMISVF
jgi:hypothetical protein